MSRPRAGRPARLALLAVAALAGCRNACPRSATRRRARRRTRATSSRRPRTASRACSATPSSARRARSSVRYALTPSKIYGDTALWTARGTNERILRLRGGYDAGHYTLAATPVLGVLRRPGDASHTIRLRRLPGDDQFAWVTDVDFAIGGVTAAGAADVVGSLLRAAEGQQGAALRADSRRAFPRGAAALGRLFTVDSIRTTPDAGGATTVQLSVSLHPERLEKSFPAFAAYLNKYVAPARYRFTLADRAGTRYFTTAAAKNRLTLRARVEGRPARLVRRDRRARCPTRSCCRPRRSRSSAPSRSARATSWPTSR
jgi:hypothetical protein